MKVAIVTGGTICKAFVEERLENGAFDRIIAVDRGAEFFLSSRFHPEYIVGDFDSVAPGTLKMLQQKNKVQIERHAAQKDETDTELALHLAISLGADHVEIYGATGSRLDHVLGNIQLLKLALDQSVYCSLIDENNRITMTKDFSRIRKEQQFGKYVSLIPFSSCVKGLTLRGMKYLLKDYTLQTGLARGVSNEIMDEVAEIELKEGILLIIESKDDSIR
ncbi:MAG: thiamine diphosphokinase [Lachnospiraceae bacterium]